MSIYESFHCHLKIERTKSNRLTGEDIWVSNSKFFFTKMPTPFITVGSSPKSTFIVDHILATHFSFNFQQNAMLVTANDNTLLKYQGQSVHLKKSDIHTANFDIDELQDFYTLLEWEIEIPKVIKISGKVLREFSLEKENIKEYLYNRYKFAKKLSESTRYLIYQVAEEKIVKLLQPIYYKDTFQLEQFSSKITAISSFETNTMSSISDVQVDDYLYVVMDYFSGQTLENYLAKKGKVEYREAILVTSKITELLKETEEKQYICRNLSLENILCGGDKKIKFTGWNIPIYPAEQNIFVAPEYFTGIGECSSSADIYSLGVIFYYLITGKPLFCNTSEYNLYILNDKDFSKEDLLKRSIYITPQLASLLVSMLSLDSSKRPSPSGVLDWLKDIHDTKLWETILQEKEDYGLQIVSSVKQTHGEICPLKDNQIFTIGRSADINIPGDYRISRQHTKIKLKDGICYLEDLGSSNGTKIDQKKIKECQIESGTCFLIGETTLCFWDYEKLKQDRLKACS